MDASPILGGAMDKRLTPVSFTAAAQFAAPAADGSRSFQGVAYSGGVITDHPYLDRVAFDLASTKVETPAPALFNHRDPVGKVDAATVGSDIRINGTLFADMPGPPKQVADMADRGMPWQMSVGIWPGSIEDIKAGTKVNLNGQTFDGPLTVFRNNRVREVSFVPLGADSGTSAQVFTIGAEGAPTIRSSDMDQAEHDRIVAEKDAKIAELSGQVSALQEKFAAQAKATRATAIAELFKAMGRTFDSDAKRDEAMRPYFALDDETFSALAADLKARPAQRDARLFQAQATDGKGADPTENSPLVADIKKRYGVK